MRITGKSNRSRPPHRCAFTLIELMVVITIIVALMALTASAVLKFVGVQQASNTQSTLDRVQSQLSRAWSKAKDQAVKEPIPPGVMALAGTDSNAAGRARIIYIKLRLRQLFPMNFAEALNVAYANPAMGATVPSSPLLGSPAYATYLATYGILPGAVSTQASPQPYESSVCLLMALQSGMGGAGINPEELMAGGAAGNINGLPFLTDAWARPIFFSRVPTGSFYLNPAGAAVGFNDPGDPEGYLQTPIWNTTYNATYSMNDGPLFSLLTLQTLAATGTSYKVAPMLASGGPANWSKPGTPLTLHPITFAPGYFTWPGGPFTVSADSGALFSTP